MAIQFDNTNTGTVTLKPGSSGTVTFVLPTSDGAAGEVIKTDGSGNLSFGAGADSAFVLSIIDSDQIYANFKLYYEDDSLAGYQRITFNTTSTENGDVVITPRATYLDSLGVSSTMDIAVYNTGLDSAEVVALITANGTLSSTETFFSTTTINQVHGFAAATYRTMKYVAQIEHDSDSKYHSEEILLTHNGTDAAINSYGQVYLDSSLGAFTAGILSGTVQLKFTPTYTNTNVKLKIIQFDA